MPTRIKRKCCHHRNKVQSKASTRQNALQKFTARIYRLIGKKLESIAENNHLKPYLNDKLPLVISKVRPAILDSHSWSKLFSSVAPAWLYRRRVNSLKQTTEAVRKEVEYSKNLSTLPAKPGYFNTSKDQSQPKTFLNMNCDEINTTRPLFDGTVQSLYVNEELIALVIKQRPQKLLSRLFLKISRIFRTRLSERERYRIQLYNRSTLQVISAMTVPGIIEAVFLPDEDSSNTVVIYHQGANSEMIDISVWQLGTNKVRNTQYPSCYTKAGIQRVADLMIQGANHVNVYTINFEDEFDFFECLTKEEDCSLLSGDGNSKFVPSNSGCKFFGRFHDGLLEIRSKNDYSAIATVAAFSNHVVLYGKAGHAEHPLKNCFLIETPQSANSPLCDSSMQISITSLHQLRNEQPGRRIAFSPEILSDSERIFLTTGSLYGNTRIVPYKLTDDSKVERDS